MARLRTGGGVTRFSDFGLGAAAAVGRVPAPRGPVALAGRSPPDVSSAAAGFASAGAGCATAAWFPQHFLYFLPDPHGQGSFRPTVMA